MITCTDTLVSNIVLYMWRKYIVIDDQLEAEPARYMAY